MEEINDKLAKIYRLVQKGATEGEREAARKALERIMKKYNLNDSALNDLDFKEYIFKYTKQIELNLLERIMFIMVPNAIEQSALRSWKKEIVSKLQYLDWVTIECAYEYFRRHMRKQWNKLVLPELKKCRKVKTRNKRRKQLSDLFFNRYVIASKLYKEEELKKIDPNEISEREAKDRMRLAEGVEGGQYNKQVVGGLMLDAHQEQVQSGKVGQLEIF